METTESKPDVRVPIQDVNIEILPAIYEIIKRLVKFDVDKNSANIRLPPRNRQQLIQ